MSRLLQITCDAPGCLNQKHEANHWWRIAAISPGTMLITGDVMRPFGEEYTVFDFCGRECALKFISEQMGKVAAK
jgi:hypothetical protein